ncbi:copper amine oxidase N-terminal domain-containing protein [Paenibacillus mendelii]|uniref:Copper amine oxidase N-terminal domain-containing protein n=1 Tax=Paenibacillus mendelii TaxID=206163 RepID=A0ABV6JGH5_9BACL|nr:copper amine oxidase N-terminal domain-containing protein [Paenibacillus mendelii]MCQ6563546.1 copper amine oxidase N-terminal domain-containing protein [Paenibacillus mendelii]
MKKVISSIVAVLLAGSLGTAAYAGTDSSSPAIPITFMGQVIKTDAAPIVDQGRVLVPARAVTEALGAKVQWDAKTKTATIQKWSEIVKLKQGEKSALINSEGGSEMYPVKLDVSVKVLHNRVYVPLRFISEQYGYRITWANNKVAIETPLGNAAQDVLYRGDLVKAREIAKSLPLHYPMKPLEIGYMGEVDGRTILFPEGVALLYYVVEGDVISQVEVKDDFALVTWQAHIKPGKTESVPSFVKQEWTDEVGVTPKLADVYVYTNSGIFGETGWEEYSYIDKSGTITEIGYMHYGFGSVDTERGTLQLLKPGEKRTDALK